MHAGHRSIAGINEGNGSRERLFKALGYRDLIDYPRT